MADWEPIPGVTVIGLGHKARHGKDTAARILSSYDGVERFSFADDLYAVCRVLHGMTEKDAPLLQRVGLELRSTHGENALLQAVHSKILTSRPRVAVITDVRFPNEFAFVKALGGVCWKVERSHFGQVFVDPSRPASHVSECALDGFRWDLTIGNPEGKPAVFAARVCDAYHAIQRAECALVGLTPDDRYMS